MIEACWLFNTGPEQVQVVLHPQSVIHSLVQYTDGSVLAQLGNPDMRTPIAHALAWPERIQSGVAPLDLIEVARLDFSEPEPQRFPCLQLAAAAMKSGGTATAILNAANEIAVAEFLENKIRFTEIARVVDAALTELDNRSADSLDAILDADHMARDFARNANRELAA